MQPAWVLRIFIGVVLFLTAALSLLYYVFGINIIKHLPQVSLCPFRLITGMPCPGCGMIRAFVSIGQLKFKEAMNFNLWAIPLFIIMIFYFCLGKLPLWLQGKWMSRLAVIFVLAFWIIKLAGT